MTEAWEMASYLDPKEADYDYTLDIGPHDVMPIVGDKKQSIYEMDDGSLAVIPISNQSIFDIELQWSGSLTEEDAGIIIALYNAPTQACRSYRTFYWKHPQEENVYTVRFMGPLTTRYTYQHGQRILIDSIRLRVEGNYFESLSS